jgi:hypothetical protein
MKPGRAGHLTPVNKRLGTTTLFAALNILDGTIIGSTSSIIATISSFASSIR